HWPDSLRPGVVSRELEAGGEPPFQSALHGVVLSRSQGGYQSGGSRAAELLEQRPARLIGANDLAGVDVQIAELACLPGGDVAQLGDEVVPELLLESGVPGLQVSSLEVFRISAVGVSSRDIDDPVANV